jgi:hypothetical protein
MKKTATTRYDIAEHLRTPKELAAYLPVPPFLFYVVIDIDHVCSSPRKEILSTKHARS